MSCLGPDDYTGGPQSVTFRTVAGDRQCINIVIIPDSEREPIECFNVNIQIPAAIAGSVVPGTPSTAEVCIEGEQFVMPAKTAVCHFYALPFRCWCASQRYGHW